MSTALAVGLSLSLLGAVWQQQEQQQLPEGRKVIDRYIEAIGGKDVIVNQPARMVKGRLEIPAQGIGGDMEIYAAPPNKLSTKVEIAGIGAIRAGYNGKVGWTMNPMVGPMLLEGRMLDQMRHQADATASLHPEDLIASVETVEMVEFEGHNCYKVKVTTRWEEEYFEFFDVESGLMWGNERTQASPMGEVPTTTVLSEYKDFDGLLAATKTVQRIMGVEQVITVTEVTKMELADDVFALPDEIKALMEPAKQEVPKQ
jgi:hypothetical protein